MASRELDASGLSTSGRHGICLCRHQCNTMDTLRAWCARRAPGSLPESLIKSGRQRSRCQLAVAEISGGLVWTRGPLFHALARSQVLASARMRLSPVGSLARPSRRNGPERLAPVARPPPLPASRSSCPLRSLISRSLFTQAAPAPAESSRVPLLPAFGASPAARNESIEMIRPTGAKLTL